MPGAVLLRRTTAAEFRAFPEELAAGRTPPELAIGVEATDRTFTTDLPYDDAVSFYDDALQARGFKVPSRNVGAGATYWTVRSPDGAPARIAVRNTHPTSFEVVTAAAAVVAPQ